MPFGIELEPILWVFFALFCITLVALCIITWPRPNQHPVTDPADAGAALLPLARSPHAWSEVL